jgi:hypothetical protein
LNEGWVEERTASANRGLRLRAEEIPPDSTARTIGKTPFPES